MPDIGPLPAIPSARSGSTFADGATPTMPMPFERAAIVPVTCVPCPLYVVSPSVGSLSGPGVGSSSQDAAQSMKSQPRASST